MANLPSSASSQERANEVTRGEAQAFDPNEHPTGVNVYDRPAPTRTSSTNVVNIVLLLLVLLVVVYFLLQWLT